jgi:purine-nucleoside/S-methyl-5'-thioadenosine phosphorylase / adenosine deaminase
MTAHAQPPLAPAATSGPADRAATSGPASGAALAGLRAAGALRLLTWPGLAASGADAVVTARDGGVSSGPYATLNLSLSVGDDPARVLENRRRLAAALGVRPGDFVFARQVHGAGVRVVGEADRGSGAFTLDDAIPDTDALVTASPGVVLAILTADCVPIVLHDPVVGVLACVHAGWRGTVARVSAAAVAAMTSLGSRPSDVIAGLGPAAAPARYQVGPDVHHAVTQAFGPASAAFIRPDPAAPGRWLLDLWTANRHALRQAGLPDPQIHVTHLPTGPLDPASPEITASPVDPAIPGTTVSPAYRDTLLDPTRHGYFFSDRAARPCGRLALAACLRKPMKVPL